MMDRMYRFREMLSSLWEFTITWLTVLSLFLLFCNIVQHFI